jgi:hypothetical protein
LLSTLLLQVVVVVVAALTLPVELVAGVLVDT